MLRHGDSKPDFRGACSVQFQSKTLIYAARSIYEVVDCDLRRLGVRLSIDFHFSACTASGSVVVLCFNGDKTRECITSSNSGTGPFIAIENSLFHHDNISIASSP